MGNLCAKDDEETDIPIVIPKQLTIKKQRVPKSDNRPEIIKYCQDGDHKALKRYIDKGYMINVSYGLMSNDLFEACKHGHTKCITLLLDAGVNKDKLITTDNAIYHAVNNGHVDCVRLLSLCGAVIGPDAHRIMEIAIKKGYKEIILILLEHDVFVIDYRVIDGLHANGYYDIIILLLKKVHDIYTTKSSPHVLSYALKHCNDDTMTLLLLNRDMKYELKHMIPTLWKTKQMVTLLRVLEFTPIIPHNTEGAIIYNGIIDYIDDRSTLTREEMTKYISKDLYDGILIKYNPKFQMPKS